MADNVHIRRLRASDPGRDALGLRSRLGSALARVDLHPHGLPEAAILCVRRLRHPLADALVVWGDARRTEAWVRAVRTDLDSVARRAVRPALSAVPANAEAVLFADRAEMLACLARDWLAGALAARWWWRGLLRSDSLQEAVVPTWSHDPRHVPAALAHLAAHGDAVPFVRALGGSVADLLLRKVLDVHALPHVAAALGGTLCGNPEAVDRPGLRVIPAATTQTPPEPSPLWQPWVGEADAAGLDTAQRCLVGITLMLQRRPHVVRSEAFARGLMHWRQAADRVSWPATLDGPMRRDEQRRTTAPIASAATASAATREPTAAQLAASEPDPPAPLQRVTHRSHASEDGDEVPVGRTDEDRRVARWHEAPVLPAVATAQTELGGLFYLINLGLFLDLYGDFTCPARPGLALSIWDFVFTVGRRLLREERSDDAVWQLLAQLAGRDAAAPPGSGFAPPDVWQMPTDWLRPFSPEGRWSWHASHDRLWVRHPEGFPVLDVPRDDATETEQLARAMQAYGGGMSLTWERGALRRSTPVGNAPLDCWLDWLLPYVRARLGQALGLADGDGVGALLLVHRARVVVTATHLDVTLALAELPCAIRLAGLDRDPGWVPAAGRFVAFHFE